MQPKHVALDTLENLCRVEGLVYLLVLITKYRTRINHLRTDNFIFIPANDSSYNYIILHWNSSKKANPSKIFIHYENLTLTEEFKTDPLDRDRSK